MLKVYVFTFFSSSLLCEYQNIQNTVMMSLFIGVVISNYSQYSHNSGIGPFFHGEHDSATEVVFPVLFTSNL